MFSTCRLIPLLTAGQQVNWDPPPQHGWGVQLDGTPLGGSRSGQRHTWGNDIHGSRAASIFPRLLTHADWTRSIPHGPAGPQRGHTQKCENLFLNATRLTYACMPENQKYKTAQYKVQCYYIQYPRNTRIHTRATACLTANFPWWFHSKITSRAKTSCCFYNLIEFRFTGGNIGSILYWQILQTYGIQEWLSQTVAPLVHISFGLWEQYDYIMFLSKISLQGKQKLSAVISQTRRWRLPSCLLWWSNRSAAKEVASPGCYHGRLTGTTCWHPLQWPALIYLLIWTNKLLRKVLWCVMLCVTQKWSV